MPHVQLVAVEREAPGAVELGRPDWPDGSIIYSGDKPNLRVAGQLEPADRSEQFEVLIVEQKQPTREARGAAVRCGLPAAPRRRSPSCEGRPTTRGE